MDFEGERKAMQEKMEAEVQELQTHLRFGFYHFDKLAFQCTQCAPSNLFVICRDAINRAIYYFCLTLKTGNYQKEIIRGQERKGGHLALFI